MTLWTLRTDVPFPVAELEISDIFLALRIEWQVQVLVLPKIWFMCINISQFKKQKNLFIIDWGSASGSSCIYKLFLQQKTNKQSKRNLLYIYMLTYSMHESWRWLEDLKKIRCGTFHGHFYVNKKKTISLNLFIFSSIVKFSQLI